MTRFDATDRRPVDKWTAAPRPTTSPQGQKPQQKQSIHMVHKPVNSECSRHGPQGRLGLFRVAFQRLSEGIQQCPLFSLKIIVDRRPAAEWNAASAGRGLPPKIVSRSMV